MSLRFSARLAERGFDVDLELAAGETVAVLGPNGAGKSTLLALLAGLLRPDAGRAELDGTVLFDVSPGSRRSAWLAPHRRSVALLSQEPLLFPHLSVLENVAFGPRTTTDRATAASRARHWLAEVDASALADRRPTQLSGGQAQRVAVGRALAAEPRLLLLDEPMAALDVAVAPALRRMLRRVLADRTAVIVTHDILDAFLLADRVVVMHEGHVVDHGPTRAVLERPTTAFTAGLAAVNLLTGVGATTSTTGDAAARVRLQTGIELSARAVADIAAGRPAGVAVRPGKVSIAAVDDTRMLATANQLPATVVDVEPRGDLVRVRTELLSADLAPGDAAALDLDAGTRILCSFEAADAVAYPL
ncbi:ABC transporter ATP-binding protein [Herbiconiux sp. KACC 21604]|uniref:sulfate/molybdate ABC transporter ATP-binding protein n=1 Tax=unclassified Herbiconiux TaxID=2618217 RepID=UPI0014924B2D|nr:ABC transporter ATP-binding protein [Herbiconiux sp. SALV-R1]QJU53148.1 ABC transporter ATP-binding protein [Herbiconiux sp. SALV-R1]WPO88091.1 ABC transporter ATP-binding protein [Herbiconiux sp. KACC 21604]